MVVNKRYLTEQQWKDALNLSFAFGFEDELLHAALQECERRYTVESCIERSFERDNLEISQVDQVDHLKSINLWYALVTLKMFRF